MSDQLSRSRAPRRGWSALLATGVTVVAALAAMTGPAAASGSATAATDCPLRALCLYDGFSFTGELFTVGSLVSPGVCVSLVDHGWGDRAHSARNTLSNSAAMFMNDDCIGGPFQIPGNSSLSSFGSFTPESVWVPRT